MPRIRKATRRRCVGCGDELEIDPRKRGNHWYCSKPQCRKASRQASQRRWLEKNPDYFRGPQSAVRQRDRRQRQAEQERPRRERPAAMSQDLIDTQVIEPTGEKRPVTRSDRQPDHQVATTAPTLLNDDDRSTGGARDAEETSNTLLRRAINQVERHELFQSDRSYEARVGSVCVSIGARLGDCGKYRVSRSVPDSL